MKKDLFEHYREQALGQEAPLAARMRPASFAEFVGQEHVAGGLLAMRRSS